jgi:hypothetical protein
MKLATWSFAVLIIGGAALDATVFRDEPARDAPNVDVQPAEDPGATIRALSPEREYIPADLSQLVENRIGWFTAADPRPINRITLDGIAYRITHPAGAAGSPVDLRVPGCADGEVRLATGETHPIEHGAVAGFFPDGEYVFTATCAGDRGADPQPTRLIVQRDH